MNDERYQQFPWNEIDRAVDGRCEADEAPPGSFRDRTFTHDDLSAALAEFARWVVFGATIEGSGTGPNQSLSRRLRADTIGARAIAAAWMLRREMFDGLPLSQVGELPNVQVSRKCLCDHTSDFESIFGVRSCAQRTHTNRAQLSAKALNRVKWQKRRREMPNSAIESQPAGAATDADPTAEAG